MHAIQSVGVLSVAKMMGAINAIFGLIPMPFLLLMSLAGSMVPNQNGPNPFAGIAGVIFGLLAPVFYGVIGFIFGGIDACLYNLLAKGIVGTEVRLQPSATQLPVG